MAAASLNQLKDITTGTAYGLDVAAMAVQNFTTRGMGIGNATSEVGKWADAVAFYGDGTNESLTTVTDALGKMMTKGTVEMDQLNRVIYQMESYHQWISYQQCPRHLKRERMES